jgi:hypothetical protein
MCYTARDESLEQEALRLREEDRRKSRPDERRSRTARAERTPTRVVEKAREMAGTK